MQLKTAIHQFLQHLKANDRSPHTISSYQRDLGVFATWLKTETSSMNVTAISPDTITRFFNSDSATLRLDGQPKQPASLNKTKLTLKSFFSFLEQAWIVKRSPARLMKCKRVRKPLVDILSPEEKKRLLATVQSSTKKRARRDEMILTLFLSTGIRIDSLTHLNIEDVNPAAKTIRLRKMKGGGQAVKPIASRLANQLQRYLSYRKGLTSSSPALFLSARATRLSRRQVQWLTRQWVQEAGIQKRISTKSFRHSFAVSLYQRTKDILVVKAALDHGSVNTTGIYAKVTGEWLASSLERL